jgi:hypothetical protein
MRALVGLLLMTAILVAASGSAAGVPSRTEVVRWSPFESAGNLKQTLKVETVHGRCTDIGYTFVGGIAYRCGSGNGLYNACFRDGPNPTDYVICVGYPWQTSVTRLRSPHLLLYPGVTFTAAADFPWGIVLDDGDRCGVLQGAHDTVRTHGRTYVVDYGCQRDNLVLLREGIERGWVWQVNAARWSRTTGYTFLGHQPVRRVYFGTLPPPIARQNTLANRAYNAARRIIWQRAPQAHLDLVWLRLVLPRADWAYAIFTPADVSFRGWFAVLHRVDGKWMDASAYKPYCTNLPKQVRQQLFLDKKTRNPRPENFMAPRGETRC